MLTVTKIKGFKAKTKCDYQWDSSGERGTGRLGVQILPSGSKTFIFRYFKNSKRVFIQIGKFPEMPLVKAREFAGEYGAMLKEGLDPKSELEKVKKEAELLEQQRQAQREADEKQGSLEQLVDGYVERLALEGKRTGERMRKALITDVYNVITPTTKAKDVTPQHIKLVLAKMIQRGAAAHSNKVRAYLHAAFNFGLKHDNDPANLNTETLFNIDFNPVSAVPKQTHADKVGENWLRLEEVKQLIGDANEQYFPEDVFILIKLCIYLGGQRPYEVMASKWEHVDFDNRTFEISKDVSKNYRPNLLPLTDTALALFHQLHELNGGSVFLFPRPTQEGHLAASFFAKRIRMFCESAEFRKFVPRDLRRTVKTLTGEIGLSKDIRDRLQNHALNDVSSKHYDRYEYMPEKRKALEAWEQRLNEKYVNNVITIGRR